MIIDEDVTEIAHRPATSAMGPKLVTAMTMTMIGTEVNVLYEAQRPAIDAGRTGIQLPVLRLRIDVTSHGFTSIDLHHLWGRLQGKLEL